MKKLFYSAVTFFAAAIMLGCCSSRQAMENRREMYQELQALREYHKATEKFMHELDDDTDGLVLEAGSDAGCDYWDAKIALENLYNEK